jgi:hypothetical protein
MSASGVDKTKLDIPGRDILLVTGYAPERNTMIMSVPPNVEPRRVSVDAIEHWMIYREHPGAGAILHVHAWMQGIAATDVNYPCGTEELTLSVAELIHRDRAHAGGNPRPDRAVPSAPGAGELGGLGRRRLRPEPEPRRHGRHQHGDGGGEQGGG